MKAKPIVMLGLDAFDPGTAWRLARAGHLPAIAGLFRGGSRCRVRNPYGLFVGSIWISLATGNRPERHGYHCWDEIDVDTYVRRMNALSWDKATPFWETLSRAGRRLAVIDVPHTRAGKDFNGLHVSEYGCHDRHFGFNTWPPARAADIEAAFASSPVLGINSYATKEFASDDYIHRAGRLRTIGEERAFYLDLQRGLAAKRDLLSALIREEQWDLFLGVFGESHAVGHQQWHLHDAGHPRFDPASRAAVGCDPLLEVYRAIDAGVADLIAAAGPDATILVLMSHGMGAHHDGGHLLDEVLTAIDWHDRGPPPLAGPRDIARRAIRALPIPVRAAIGRAGRVRGFAAPYARARQRFFLEPNNGVYGGIRINLAGREPRGCVLPEEFDQVCRDLEGDLLELVNVDTGKPAVRNVRRCDAYHGRSATDTMPDLFVDWDRSAPIETVRSAKTGTIHAAYRGWRTGDHRPAGLLLARGDGFSPNKRMPGIDVEDLAPSIAARMGVALDDVDGQAVSWLSGAALQ